MSKELAYLLFVQVVVSLNTIAFFFGIKQAMAGNIALHKKINGIAAISTVVGALGLVVTVLLGWDYSDITTPTRMLIHRCFAVPLFPLLVAVIISGIKGRGKAHKVLVKMMMPFWFGTLITGWWFFNTLDF